MTPAIDGIHPLKHRDTFGPCLFMEVTSANWRQVLDVCTRGAFKWLMTDLFWGDWHTPRNFTEYASVRAMCSAFRNAGVRIAAHCYLNTIDANAKLIGFKNPQWDWGDVLEGDEVGTIFDADDDVLRLVGGNMPLVDTLKNHLAYAVIASGKSMMTVKRHDATNIAVNRKAEGTSVRPIRVGDPVYRLRNRSGFFAKYGSELQELLVHRFTQTVTDCGIDWVYCDGYSSSVQGVDAADTARLHWEQGIAPYTAHVPAVFSLGGTVPECAFDRVFSVMRGDAVTLFNGQYNNKLDKYVYDQLRWNHVNLPLHQASGWWPLWASMPAEMVERYYAVCGQVVLQDYTDNSFLNHPNRDGIVRRMRELNLSV